MFYSIIAPNTAEDTGSGRLAKAANCYTSIHRTYLIASRDNPFIFLTDTRCAVRY